MTLRAGARLGPYEIEAPLGSGGMGEVFKARDTRLDRTVAVKIIAFDVDPAGRFLVLQENAAPAPDEFRVVLGWSQRARSK
jgi:eukaryotic-like serine/threonine-protein kinase